MCVLITITCTARNPAYGMSNDAVRNPDDLSNDAVRNPACDLSNDAVRNPAYDLSNDAVRNPAYDSSNDAVRNPAYDLSVRQAPNDAASVQSKDEDVYEDIPGTKGVHDSICLSLTLADHY